MIHIITQFYKVNYENCKNDLIRKRQDEITFCFKQNLLNKNVKNIHFLYEKQEDVDFLKEEGIDLNDEKIVLFNLGCRMKYSLVLNYANEYLKNKICVYLHSDMYIYSGFNLLNNNYDNNTVYALTSHNPLKCNRQFICKCTRQFKTSKGWYGVTFDGFVFKTPIKNKVIQDADHIVHVMGAETRLICILKENGYKVICPNNILMCMHCHQTKIFAKQHSKWINRKGEMKPLAYYSNIHRQQRNKPWDHKIVGGGIPFFMGSCKFVNKLSF